MGGVVVLTVIIAGWVLVAWANNRQQLMLAEAQATAHLRHLRDADFPSTCSWCKNTTLARKLILFERVRDGWKASDVIARLAICADDAVENLSTVLTGDQPRWRRICTERCARELLASEQVATVEPFVSCEYCSTRSPAALSRCSNCGAVRVSA